MCKFVKFILSCSLFVMPLSGIASNNGIPGYSQNETGSSSCHDCHTVATSTSASTAQITGNNTAIIGTTNTYTFKLIAPRATSSYYAGFNLSASNGSLISTSAATTIINSELVQSAKQTTTDSGTSFDAQWSFDWQAPSVSGSTTLFACGLPVNGDGIEYRSGEHGTDDGRVACTTLAIQVQQPPTALAGSNQTVTEGDTVTLDGTSSNDVDGVINSYLWEQISGNTATLNNATTDTASFAAPAVASNTTDELIFRLTVTDNDGLTDTSLISIFVQDVLVSNLAPVPNAGTDQIVDENTLVTLDASGSTDDGNIASYQWLQTAGISSITLSDNISVSPTFTSPAVTASNDVLSFQLTVTDDLGVQSTDTVNITVNDVDTPPTAVISDASGVLISNVNNNSQITLYGNFSTDPEGPVSAYSWSQTAGSAIVSPGVSNASSFTFTTPDNPGTTIDIQLTVTGDEGFVQNSITATLTLVNRAPTANAGTDQLVNELAGVNLDGSLSTDIDGVISSYLWVQLTGITAILSDDTSNIANFTAPDVSANTTQELTFQLTVTDNYGDTDLSIVSIFVQDALITNQIPVADAGLDQVVNEKTLVTLDASNSSDDGSIASYLWEQTAGISTVTLDDNTLAIASFTAPMVTSANDSITFKLTVTDDLGVQANTFVNIAVNDVDTPPVASITDISGAALSVIINNNLVTLYGTYSSDAEGPITAYSWSQTAGPGIISPGASNLNTFSFTTPDSPASSISIQLTVTGDEGSVQTATSVSLTLNNAPVIGIGIDQTLTEATPVTLDGSTSFDSDGTLSSYLWEQLSGPPVTLTNASTSTASYTAPAVASNTTEQQVFRLTITDNSGFTSTGNTNIFVEDVLVANIAPIANAGINQSVNENTLVTLDASASSDDGSIITFLWQQISGTNTVILNDTGLVIPSFTSPFVSNAGDIITFLLTVTDDLGVQSSSSVNITILDVDTPPVALITDASGIVISSINNNSLITLYGNFSNDIDGPISAYSWSQTAGSAIVNPGATSLNSFTFTAPDDLGNSISIQLTVTGDEGSIQDSVSITLNLNNLPPVISPIADKTIIEGGIIELHGEVSDPNNDLASVLWRQINCGSTCINLPIADQSHISFITPSVSAADSGRILEFELTATDSTGLTTTAISKYTLTDNGINKSFPDDTISFNSYNNLPMAIKVESLSPDISAIISNLLPEPNSVVTDNTNRPLSFPYELKDLEISLSAPGTVLVTLYFPEPVSKDFDFYQYMQNNGWTNTSKAKNFDDINYNSVTGWSEISEEVEFSVDRRNVKILLTDGGPSDQSIANGIIRSKSGLGENPASTDSQPGASGSLSYLFLLSLLLLPVSRSTFVQLKD